MLVGVCVCVCLSQCGCLSLTQCVCLPEHDKYRGVCLQPTIELRTWFPVEELEKGSKKLKGFAAPNNTNE